MYAHLSLAGKTIACSTDTIYISETLNVWFVYLTHKFCGELISRGLKLTRNEPVFFDWNVYSTVKWFDRYLKGGNILAFKPHLKALSQADIVDTTVSKRDCSPHVFVVGGNYVSGAKQGASSGHKTFKFSSDEKVLAYFGVPPPFVEEECTGIDAYIVRRGQFACYHGMHVSCDPEGKLSFADCPTGFGGCKGVHRSQVNMDQGMNCHHWGVVHSVVHTGVQCSVELSETSTLIYFSEDSDSDGEPTTGVLLNLD
jgi:hypothetical protein